MRPHRAFVPELKEEVRLTGREARHLLRVLRARVGDRLTVFDGRGREAEAEVVAVEPGALVLRLGPVRRVDREVRPPVTLYLALLKGEKLADVVRAASELGVARFALLTAERSVPRGLGEEKLARLRRVAAEAAKQSGRSVLPEVLPPRPLAQVPAVLQGLVAHPGAEARVADRLDPSRPVALAVGPEGGFTEAEVRLLAERGFSPVSLGRRVLRAETAACALVALVTAGTGR